MVFHRKPPKRKIGQAPPPSFVDNTRAAAAKAAGAAATAAGITPQSIQKDIREGRLAGTKIAPEDKKSEIDYSKMDKKEVRYYIEELKDRMDLASKNLEFERAGELRDEIILINQSLRRKKHKV